MFNGKRIGNRIGFGCWSSYCGSKQQAQNNPCYNLSGLIISASPVISNVKVNTTNIPRRNI